MNEHELFADDASVGEPEPVSSSSLLQTDVVKPEIPAPQFLADEIESAPEDPLADPVFALLATPKLPELPRENRARLHVQSPNRIYFYWSIKNNPFQILHKVFGGDANNYQLVLKFVNLRTGHEEIRLAEAEGNYWLNVDSDTAYQAEIGFYAPYRPYVRIIFSNQVETPRKTPSHRSAQESEWAISADRFARVLNTSGFAQDAVEVVLAGDNAQFADAATAQALNDIVGDPIDVASVNLDEVRSVLLALAAGVSLESLRGSISEALYQFLLSYADQLTAARALTALTENFEVFGDEFGEDFLLDGSVVGASQVNLPRGWRARRRAGEPSETANPADRSESPSPLLLPKLAPFSSHNLRK